MKPTAIIGAGLAGLLAAHHFRDIPIFEAGRAKENHQALLRFRTKSVSTLTGIPFKEVTVRKAIFTRKMLVDKCDILTANLYSLKVLGKVTGERSIWNLDPVQRYIAPTDFWQQMVDKLKDRIKYETPYEFGTNKMFLPDKVVINTAPLPIVLKSLGLDAGATFKRAPIIARRYAIPECENVYQTVYFPDADTSVYRASITDSTLIIESVEEPKERHIQEVFCAFGLPYNQSAIYSTTPQEYGKIVSLDRMHSRCLMARLTDDYGIYSLGRFATWRNILLDDVADDILQIDALIKADSYQRKLLRK